MLGSKWLSRGLEWSGSVLSALGLEEGLAYQPTVRRQMEKTLGEVAQAMLPAGGAIPYSAEDTGVVEYLLVRFSQLPSDKRDLFVGTLLMYEFVFPAFFRRGWRFSSMSAEQREAMMRDLEYTNVYIFRMLSTMIRVFVCMAYLADERVLREMEFFKMNAYESDPRDIELRPNFTQWPPDVAKAEQVIQEMITESRKNTGTETASVEHAA